MLIENNGIKYYSSEKASNLYLQSGASVRHAFFTRVGGLSEPPFNTLNIDPRIGDDPISVSSNLKVISEVMGFDESKLVMVKQVHGDKIYKVEEHAMSSRNMEADAIITNARGIAISVKTADCVPLFIIDTENSAVAAVHAGWRGTVEKIAAKTLNSMNENYGTRSDQVAVIIGPHIKECCYEVSDDVKGAFEKAFYNNTDGFFNDRYLNLAEANKRALTDAGVGEDNIATEGSCTCCNEDLFFSHRRDGTPGPTGRQISIIIIKD